MARLSKMERLEREERMTKIKRAALEAEAQIGEDVKTLNATLKDFVDGGATEEDLARAVDAVRNGTVALALARRDLKQAKAKKNED